MNLGTLTPAGAKKAYSQFLRRMSVSDPTRSVTGRPGQAVAQEILRGGLTKKELNRILNDPYRTIDYPGGGKQQLHLLEDYLEENIIRNDKPFSILRPKRGARATGPERIKSLMEVGNTSFGGIESAGAGIQRRFLPRWFTDLMERGRKKLRPGASTQGTQCAGGVCRVTLGKGVYNIPSDLRHMFKDFETVADVVPQDLLLPRGGLDLDTGQRFKWRHTGNTVAESLANMKKIMRRTAGRTALPGILAGLGLAGWGAHGLASRKRPGRLDLKKFLESK